CAGVAPRKYLPVVSEEQRQSYEEDFSAEFEEYRRLHAQVEAVVRKFSKLQQQWNLLSPASRGYEVKEVKPGEVVPELF
ncbi:ELL2 factor, partial [Indicator maculatus]|nr:ELL2 factor [Indicator maculatus]